MVRGGPQGPTRLVRVLANCLAVIIGIQTACLAAGMPNMAPKKPASLQTPTPANLWLLDPRIFNWPVLDKDEPVQATSPIIERKPGVSDAFLREINAAIDHLPPHAVKILAQSGYRITVAPKITDAVPAAANEQVRGYEDNPSWNSVYGMFNRTSKRVVMAELAEQSMAKGVVKHERLQDKTRRIGILKHEFGHAVDHYLGNVSHSPKFLAAYKEGMQSISLPEQAVLSYYLQPGVAGAEETFAELFALQNGDGSDTRSDILLKNHFNKMIGLIDQQVAQLQPKDKPTIAKGKQTKNKQFIAKKKANSNM